MRCASWSTASRRSSRSLARPGSCISIGAARRPRREPGDDRGLRRVPARPGQARRSTTPSTSSTATRPTATTRWPASRRPSRPGAEAVICCDTNGATLPTAVAAAVRRRRRGRGSARAEVGIHTHNDAELRGREQPGRRRGRRPPGAGHDQRLRRALRQRQPDLDRAEPAAQARASPASAPDDLRRLTRLSHEAAEIVNLPPDAHAAYVGRFAFAHKGGMHVAGVAGRRAHVRAPRPRPRRQRAATCWCRSCRAARPSARAPRSSASSSTRPPSTGRSRA